MSWQNRVSAFLDSPLVSVGDFFFQGADEVVGGSAFEARLDFADEVERDGVEADVEAGDRRVEGPDGERVASRAGLHPGGRGQPFGGPSGGGHDGFR